MSERISMASVAEIERAYRHCRNVTLTHAKTFYFASYFLERRKRDACYAVYAFCRHIDDLIDEGADDAPGTRATIDRTIAKWQSDLDRVYAGKSVDTPVMVAWADTLRRYSISRSLPDELIEGVTTDLRPTVRMEDFDDLYRYCYKVASVVGLMTTEIFGYDDPAALRHAADLGIAMQLTNILRDIGEDYRMNRIYLPQTELEEFNVTEEQIARGTITPEFRRLMRFQIDRAHRYYESADLGIPMLKPDSRLTVRLMSHNYRQILGAIERNEYNVFSRRAAIPLRRKLMSVPTIWWETKLAGASE